MVRARSLAVEESVAGRATLRIVLEGDGSVFEERLSGSIADVRVRARSIASAHDLIPIWADSSWIKGGARRPPASRWEQRRQPDPF
jgi:hypothetical protein